MEPLTRNELLERYLEEHSSPEDEVLAELRRHTFLKEAYPQMLSGPVMGGFLQLFSTLLSPLRILEIGTYTGYSAIRLARGLAPKGKLISIEVNEELRATALLFFEKAGVKDKIELLNGDALELIPKLEDGFDLVFIDAQKENYSLFYELAIKKVRPGGYLIADNVLWGGKVIVQPDADPATRAIDRFNKMIREDDRINKLLIPLKDGVMLMQKR